MYAFVQCICSISKIWKHKIWLFMQIFGKHVHLFGTQIVVNKINVNIVKFM